jgi:hypothetical protein
MPAQAKLQRWIDLRAALLRRMIRPLAALCLLLAPVAAAAQGAAWNTVQQPAMWLNAFVDHSLTDRTAFWFDGHWRRMEFGREPQQLLLRPGFQVTLRPGVRVGAGYTYVATAPYGESPNALPTREHRGWQQLSLAHRAGKVGLSYRLRLEQRWIAPVLEELGPFAYQQRVRVLARAQVPLATTSKGTLIGFAYNEYFLPIGHSDARNVRLQNRAGLGIGIPLDARQRIDIGYMNQWNRITPRETHEINHTLVIGWVWTAVR